MGGDRREEPGSKGERNGERTALRAAPAVPADASAPASRWQRLPLARALEAPASAGDPFQQALQNCGRSGVAAAAPPTSMLNTGLVTALVSYTV
jgi:hypothetical protein